MNQYTLNALLYQRERLEQLLKDAKYQDETRFYTDCLNQVNKDIDNIGKNTSNNDENSSNSEIFE